MPIFKKDEKLIFEFGTGDIVFGSAYEKGDENKTDFVVFWQSDEKYQIGKLLPELVGEEIGDWELKMIFPKKECINSLVDFLLEYRDKKWPPAIGLAAAA